MSIEQKAKTIRKELDKITAEIGSTETMIINELFDSLVEEAQEAVEEVHKDYIQEFELRAKLERKLEELKEKLHEYRTTHCPY